MSGKPPSDIVDEFVKDTLTMPTKALAIKYNRAPGTIRDWRRYLKRNGYKVGYGLDEKQELDEPLYVTGDVVIVGDIEIPDHDPQIVELVLELGSILNIKTFILNGDLVALDEFSRWPQTRPSGDLYSSLTAAKRVLTAFRAQFDTIYHCMGNHERRLPIATKGQVHIDMLLDEVRSTRYSYLFLNGDWLVVHPDNYSKNPLTVSRDLAEIYHKNVVAGHTHHLAMGRDKSGLYWAVDGGCARDPNRTWYITSRITRHPRWNPGFVVILNNRPYLIDKNCDLEFWRCMRTSTR